MNEIDQQILDTEFQNFGKRRRELLPIWIKVFIWIFLVFGILAPIALILGIFGYEFELSLYGLQTTKPFSLIGLMIIFLFSFKAIVAFGLWNEKGWAVNMAEVDAILGIAICIYIMAIHPFISSNFNINIKLEFFILIPYYIKMHKIKSEWAKIEMVE